MTVDVATEVVIERPLADVASYAEDPANAPAWYANIASAAALTEPPLRPGSRFAFVATFLRRRLEYTYEVTEYRPHALLVMLTSDGPFPMETTYEWKPVGDRSTQMRLRNRGRPAGFSRLLAPFMGMAVRAANRADLARLKSLLEAEG